MGLRVLKIGEESVIPLTKFDVGNLKRKVRRADRHCAELGIRATIYGSSELPKPIENRQSKSQKRGSSRRAGRNAGSR